MRRMRAIARGIGWGVVLLLAVAAVGCAGLWVRSYNRSDLVRYCEEDGTWCAYVSTCTDQLVVELTSARDERPLIDFRGWGREMSEKRDAPDDWRQRFANYPGVRASRGFASLEWFAADGRADGDFAFPRIWAVGVPLWLVMLITGAVPLLATRKAMLQRRARLRRQHGLCGRCGYDLRASSERCPECGTPVAA